jgi:general secretion pathway protein G
MEIPKGMNCEARTMRTQRNKRRSAFTLLEILIVIGILALLAVFVVPNIMGAQDEAKIGMAKAAVGRAGNLASQLKKYRFDTGAYPATEEGLEALFRRPSAISEESGQWKGPYMEGTPEELRDPWGEEYVYSSPGKFNEDSYDLYSKGPDRKEDTDDDITNWPKK